MYITGYGVGYKCYIIRMYYTGTIVYLLWYFLFNAIRLYFVLYISENNGYKHKIVDNY